MQVALYNNVVEECIVYKAKYVRVRKRK